MKSRHRIRLGENVLAGIYVPLHYHALQVERELRTDWLRLRQAFWPRRKNQKLSGNDGFLVFAFAALFRHALIALGETPAKASARQSTESRNLPAPIPQGFKRFSVFAKENRREAKSMSKTR